MWQALMMLWMLFPLQPHHGLLVQLAQPRVSLATQADDVERSHELLIPAEDLAHFQQEWQRVWFTPRLATISDSVWDYYPKRWTREVVADFMAAMRSQLGMPTGIQGLPFTMDDLEPWAREEAAGWDKKEGTTRPLTPQLLGRGLMHVFEYLPRRHVKDLWHDFKNQQKDKEDLQRFFVGVPLDRADLEPWAQEEADQWGQKQPTPRPGLSSSPQWWLPGEKAWPMAPETLGEGLAFVCEHLPQRSTKELVDEFLTILRERPYRMTFIAGVPFSNNDLEPWALEEALQWAGKQPEAPSFWLFLLQSVNRTMNDHDQLREANQVRKAPFLMMRGFEGGQPYVFAAASAIPSVMYDCFLLHEHKPFVSFSMPYNPLEVFQPVAFDAWLLHPKIRQRVRLASVQALAEMKPTSTEAVSELEKLLYVNDTETALAAAVALWRINGSSEALTMIRLLGFDTSCLHGRMRLLLPELTSKLEEERHQRKSEKEEQQRLWGGLDWSHGCYDF